MNGVREPLRPALSTLALRFQCGEAFVGSGDESCPEKRMLTLRFVFNSCIFLQRTTILLLSSYKLCVTLSSEKQRLLYILSYISPMCIFTRLFENAH